MRSSDPTPEVPTPAGAVVPPPEPAAAPKVEPEVPVPAGEVVAAAVPADPPTPTPAPGPPALPPQPVPDVLPAPQPHDLSRIAQDLQIRKAQVESVVHMLDDGNSVPF